MAVAPGDYSVIHDMVKKLAAAKPVVCLVEGRALSCGYLVASATTTIFAHSLSDVGGMGVITWVNRYHNSRVNDGSIKTDLKQKIFSVGAFKAMYEVFSPELTEQQRSYLQEYLVKIYNSMIKIVAQNRNLSEGDYKTWAEGKIFNAQEALERGLIDQIGTIF